MSDEKYFISGASGFIGGKLFNELTQNNVSVIGIGRKRIKHQNYIQCDLLDKVGLRSTLKGVSCVIHCAGYAHAFKNSSSDVREKAWLINYEGTKNLIEISVEMGVKKFINLSSVKAMSEPDSSCVDEEWELNPVSEYGKSKLAAEKIIFELGHKYSVDIINLRLCMVYGFGSNGNLDRMANLTFKHIFPPLPETNNHRSLVHVNDVIAAIIHVANDCRANGETFIVAGPDAPSGREIYNQMRKNYGYKNINFEIPRVALECIAYIFEKIQNITGINMQFNKEILSRLLDSAWYSTKKIENLVNWYPKVTLEVGLQKKINKI